MVSSLKTRVLRELTVVLVFLLVFYFKISAGNPILNILQLNERAAGRCVRATVRGCVRDASDNETVERR